MPFQVVLPCDNCGPTAPMAVDVQRTTLRCVRCGSERVFVRRPVYLITGAPSAGKTTVALRLAGRIDRLPVFDTDLFGEAAHPDWASWATTWLLVAHGLANSGLSTVLCGYGLHRTEIDALPARKLVGDLHTLNLDLEEEELRSRLGTRPDYDAARIERKVAAAARLRGDADLNIEVSGMSVDQIVDRVEHWLRTRPDIQASS